jgi:hypothetical protein
MKSSQFFITILLPSDFTETKKHLQLWLAEAYQYSIKAAYTPAQFVPIFSKRIRLPTQER